MLNQLIHLLTQNKQRCLLWVKGEQRWAHSQIQSWLSQTEPQLQTVWFGETDTSKSSDNVQCKSRTQNQITDVRIKQYKKMLGQESDVLVYDAYAGLNPDALGALVGTIKQGGVCIVISPNIPQWLEYVDPEYSRLCVEPYQPEQISHYYIQHFIDQLLQSTNVLSISQNDTQSPEQVLQNWCDVTYVSEAISSKITAKYEGIENLNNNPAYSANSTAPVSTYLHTPVGTNLHHKYYKICKTEDQLQVVKQLFELSQNKTISSDLKLSNRQKSNKQAAVIQSDRGRGKSASLGLFAGLVLVDLQTRERLNDPNKNNSAAPASDSKLEPDQSYNIVLTAPHLTSVSGVFHFCEVILEQHDIAYRIEKNTLKTELGRLTFVAPDELVNSLDNADIILVDEAAAIPSQMLLPLLAETKLAATSYRYELVVFSTTIHGYEGTGRGFEYKFKPMLDRALGKVFDSVTNLSLTQPIRWAADDFLEADINQLLMINAQVPALRYKSLPYKNKNTFEHKGISNSDNVSFNSLTPESLIKQTDKLASLFGLLVNAHYRTTPNDLRNMLDGPNMKIFSLEYQGEIIGAMLLAKEGKLNSELAEQIWQGRRRPKGHLLPQSLIAHSGFKQAGDYRYARVVRIAIHPELQNQGLGSLMLEKAKQVLTKDEFDFIGTSFGITEDLVKFWLTNQFVPVRLGLKAEASTGEYSLLMVQALNQMRSPNHQDFEQALNIRFQQTLFVERSLNIRRDLSEGLLQRLSVQNNDGDIGEYTEQDKQDLICFCHHHRSLDTSLLAMRRFINKVTVTQARIEQNSSEKNKLFSPLILDKVVNGIDNKTLIQKYKLTGEKQLVQTFRESLTEALKALI